jgi:hypothetical protein
MLFLYVVSIETLFALFTFIRSKINVLALKNIDLLDFKMSLDVIIPVACIEESFAAVLARVWLIAIMHTNVQLQGLLFVSGKFTTFVRAEYVRGLLQMIDFNMNEDALPTAKGSRASLFSICIGALEPTKFIVHFLKLLTFFDGLYFVIILHNIIKFDSNSDVNKHFKAIISIQFNNIIR